MFNKLSHWLQQLFERIFENPLFRRVVKNSGYLFSATGISAALSMLQGILVARLLGVENYGILGAILAFTGLINNLASFRMNELVIKYVGHYTESNDSQRAAAIFKMSVLVESTASIISFGLICLLAPLGAEYLAKDPSTAYLFMIYGVVVLFNMITETSSGMLQIFDRFRLMGGLGLAGNTITLVLVVMVYLLHGSLLGVLLAYLAGKAISAIGLALSALVEAWRRWGRDWPRVSLGLLRSQTGELARFAVNTNISATISLVTKDSELLWVSLLRNPLETGYYKLALTLANIVQIPVNPLPQATYPELSRQAARRGWDNFHMLLRQGSYLAGGYTLAATGFLLLFGQPLIALVYSPEYLPAYPALIIVLAGYLVANIFYWRRSALLALGHAGFPARLNLILAAVKMVGTLLFVPHYGYLAEAALLSAFYWASSLISVLKIRAVLARQGES
jgi:O-antigen/teichoic acid export membrane protein